MYVPAPTLQPLIEWIQQQTGLHITEVNQQPVELALKVLSSESRVDEKEYVSRLICGEINPQPFIDTITTHESFFLRHQKTMRAAIRQIIMPLLERGIRPRILSAPCAQGEEPYSFAMLLQEYGIDPGRVEITAVDIASSSIQQAKQGRFRKYALRKVPDHFIRHHFHEEGGLYTVANPKIRQSIRFLRANLLTQAHTHLSPGYHLIFSHNMMIYFDHSTNQKMVRIFRQLLDQEGYLFVDAVETNILNDLMERDMVEGVRAFRKPAPGNKVATTQPQPPTPTVAPARSVPHKRQPAAAPPPKRGVNHSDTLSSKRRSAEQAYKNKQFDEAIKLYDQLIENHPTWASWARVGKARVLIDSGAEMEALEEAEAALSGRQMAAGIYLTNDDMADAHAIIALVLNNKGIHAGKIDHLQQVAKFNPRHPVLQLIR
jgi:chemotaxis protein methyltransferase WspC